jgi:hypothetical protein
MTPLVLWIGGSALVAYMGRDRRIGALGFFILSMLFSPLFCLIILLLTSPGKTPASSS